MKTVRYQYFNVMVLGNARPLFGNPQTLTHVCIVMAAQSTLLRGRGGLPARLAVRF
jgi:hypothetical protein